MTNLYFTTWRVERIFRGNLSRRAPLQVKLYQFPVKSHEVTETIEITVIS